MAGPGRIIRPTSGFNAPRNVNDSGRRNQPFRYVRPMGPGSRLPIPWLYVGTFNLTPFVQTNLYRVNSATGEYTVLSTGVLSSVRSISCDPTTGNIYVAGHPGNVYCLDSEGAILWEVSVGGGANVSDLCVSNDGSVYVAFLYTDNVFPTLDTPGSIVKLDASTGAEITSGWPYAPSSDASFNCVCVDRSGNVYSGCGPRPTNRAISFSADGSIRWVSEVTNVVTLSDGGGVQGLAINALGTELIATRFTVTSQSALHSHYFLDAATGAITSSFRPLSGTGVPSDGCDYGQLDVAYSIAVSSDADVADVYSGSGPFFNTGTAFGTQGLVCTRDGGVFVTAQADAGIPEKNFNVWSCVGGWKTLLPASVLMYAIESSEGRCGAFAP